jgi:hypothetical protein
MHEVTIVDNMVAWDIGQVNPLSSHQLLALEFPTHELERVEEIKDLEVFLDNKMTMTARVPGLINVYRKNFRTVTR